MKDAISEYIREEKGTIRLGGSTFRLSICAGPVLREFSGRYPNVRLKLDIAFSDQSIAKVLNGDLDMAIASAARFDEGIISHKLLFDELYICVADELLEDFAALQDVE